MVEATPVAARIGLAGVAQRAAERLERGLGQVVVVAARAAQVERRARGPGERLEGMLDELERQPADALAAERQVDHRVRPATDIDDGRGDRLVHRARRRRRTGGCPARSPSASRERRPEDERDVLDGVVLVDLEVAVRLDREVEEAVVRERAQEVVVEADPGVDGRVAGAVEPEGDGDVGLAGGPGDRHAAALARADGEFAERGGHAGDSVVVGAVAPLAGAAISFAASMSRSFSSGSRTVRRSEPASGVPAPGRCAARGRGGATPRRRRRSARRTRSRRAGSS